MDKRAILIAAALPALPGSPALTGCKKWDGVGKDIETTGEAMQDDD